MRGTFRITGFYDAHPSSSPPGTRITGVITAPGVPATAAEHKADERGRWADVQELPVLVDKTDPSRFAVLWDEVRPVAWRDLQTQAARAEADRINAGPDTGPPPSSWSGPGNPTVSSSTVTIGPDGQPLSPEEAAAVQRTLDQVFGQMGGQEFGAGFGQAISQAVEQALGQAANQGGASYEGHGYEVPGHEDQSGGPPHGGFSPAEAAQFLAAGGGEEATAIVLAARELPQPPGIAVTPGGTVDMTLEITRADGSRYTTPTRLSFSTPQRRDAVATPGIRLRVRIDPNAPSRVAIDPAGLF